MQILKNEIYKQMLFVDKQAFNKSNTSRSIIECLSIIVAKANYNGIIVNHKQRSEILKKLKFFFSNIQLKLSKCTHNFQRFERNEATWLDKILITVIQERLLGGRPLGTSKDWEDKGESARYKELQDFVENNSLDKLISAAALKAFKEEKRDLRWVLNILNSALESASLFKVAYQSSQKKDRQIKK